jgi:hypothetical protein|tara:strand:+ start:487 stop:648 length:162 start_codon:yes stop_codon:yes gene_type:complete
LRSDFQGRKKNAGMAGRYFGAVKTEINSFPVENYISDLPYKIIYHRCCCYILI